MEVHNVVLAMLYKSPLPVMAGGFFVQPGRHEAGFRGMVLPCKPASWQKMAIPMANIGYLDF